MRFGHDRVWLGDGAVCADIGADARQCAVGEAAFGVGSAAELGRPGREVCNDEA